VFTLRLPRIALPDSDDTPLLVPIRVRSRRVLLVEDNDDAREMLKFYLERQGHEVFEAADGAEGIKMASELRPELALIDIGLPLIDGYEVARYVRRHQLPVCLVALTDYGQPEDHQRCMDAGFDEHIVKPVDPERLTELLRKPASHSSGHVG
jgi:two-component system, sensor histidine kinase